ARELSSANSLYFGFGAGLLFFVVGPLFDRWGARIVVTIGTVAMACGVVALTLVTRRWQIYAAFGVMSLGWATMSGAGINIIVAPWFESRRGLALSWAMNGASAGGIVLVPLLILSFSLLGLSGALDAAAVVMLAVLIPTVLLVLRPRRPDEHDPMELRLASPEPVTPTREAGEFRPAAILRSRAFITVSIPFALALTAQVGLLTHQVAFLSPGIGTTAAGWAISVTTSAAVIGR